MPTGLIGQGRPASVVGNAVRVMRIATGEEADDVVDDGKDPARRLAEHTPRSAGVQDVRRNGGHRGQRSANDVDRRVRRANEEYEGGDRR